MAGPFAYTMPYEHLGISITSCIPSADVRSGRAACLRAAMAKARAEHA